MSRFYGTLNAGRSTATKCGHKTDGISATARGWDIGGEVSMRDAAGVDVVELEVTPGSNGAGNRLHVAQFVLQDRGAYRCTGGALFDLIEAARAAELWAGQYADVPGHEAAAGLMVETLRAALARLGVTA